MLKHTLLAAVIVTISLFTSPAVADDAAETISVLIIDGQNNHDWRATTPVLVDALESCGRFTADVSTTPEGVASDPAWADWRPAFADYDAVLSNYNGTLWPEEVREAFHEYVHGGGAFVCVHAANNSFPEWPEYNRMIGVGGWGGRNEESGPYIRFRDGEFILDESPGAGGSHGPQHEFVVTIRDSEHPITQGMPENWLHTQDELYDSLRGPALSVEVLATAYSEVSGEHEPMMMTIDYGEGRVFHTPMGHADYSMRCVGFYTTLQRGTEWAATGEVTIPIPDNFPSENAVSAVAAE
jgi:type 1 glutamine amidotransferase